MLAEALVLVEEDGAVRYQQFTHDMACSLIRLASGIYYLKMPIGSSVHQTVTQTKLGRTNL